MLYLELMGENITSWSLVISIPSGTLEALSNLQYTFFASTEQSFLIHYYPLGAEKFKTFIIVQFTAGESKPSPIFASII